MDTFLLACSDDGADVLAGERTGKIAGEEAVHYLYFADVACGGEQIEHRELEDRILQPLCLHLGHRDLWNKSRTLRGLWVFGVQTVFVFHIDHRLAAKLLRNEEASGISAV